jgi:predicted lipid-binding transport protein (Tim44 family)
MNKLISILVGLIGLSLVAIDADAKRLSGGRNLGLQRSAPAQQQAAPKAPAQQQQQAVPATPAQQPAAASKWLGPLAGLALGAGLAALFLNNGMTGLLAGLLVIGLIVFAMMFLARALRGKVMQQPLQYAGTGAGQPVYTELPGGAGAQSVAASTGRWPAGFDADGFVRHARLNFVRLQDAYDKNDLTTMRDFLAPAVYREIESDISAGGDAPKQTEVMTLEAEVLDVAEEGGSYVVSVRFSGLTREAGGQPEPFSETWHLEKPVKGNAGWLVAGIQQS